MKKYIICLFILISQIPIYGQNISGHIIDENKQAIIGASIFLKGTNSGTISNKDGEFNLVRDGAYYKLIVSAVGYNPDTVTIPKGVTQLNITLKTGVELSDLVVSTSTPGSSYDRNSITNLQNITSGELRKAACCNLSESFETNPSVDVSYSDAATGAKQIKLLGLAGIYVQMLHENVPTLRGIAAPYGLGYTPGPWMEGIQISKGTASVKNGYESVTGQINIEYLKPDKSDRLGINVYANDAGRLEGNINSAIAINKYLSTVVLAHIEDEIQELDSNKDGFMDQPMVRQQNIMNNWKYFKNNYFLHTSLRFLNENRIGGQLSKINNPYTINIDSKRYEFFAKNGFLFDDKNESSVALILSGSLHENNSQFGIKNYNGDQENWYANLIYDTGFSKKHKLSLGSSWTYDNYNEYLNAIPINNNESTPGIFAEYTFNHNDKYIVLAGIRADKSSLYGMFYTPRVHIKYNVAESFNLRVSAGKGFRTPNVLAENSFLLASSRDINISTKLQQEEAWNYGVTATGHIPLFNKELNIQGEFFFTNFLSQVVSDLDTDPHAVNIINVSNGSYSKSYQIEASYELLRGWSITAAHRITDSKATINGKLREKPLTNRYKSLITSSYQTKLKKWQFDLTALFNGGGRLPDPDTNNPKWATEFKPYTIINAQVTKYFRTWSIYLGSENLSNFIQKDPIIDVANPTSTDFDASMVWGPIHGRKIYAGLRWNIPAKETNKKHNTH